MGKILKTLFVLLIGLVISNPAHALTFEEAYNSSYTKPSVVLVYAEWVGGKDELLRQYRLVANYLKNVYNFAELDLTKKDASFFNTKFEVQKNLPYVMMFRDGGKICRFIPRDCASDAKCLAGKLKSYIK